MRSKTPKKRRRGPVIAVIIAAAVAAMAILFLTGVIGGSAQAGFVVDDKATATTQLTAENAQDALQKAVDESMFSFRINSNMVFANGNEEGEMVIESPAHNRYGMRVELSMNEDVYKRQEQRGKLYHHGDRRCGRGQQRDRGGVLFHDLGRDFRHEDGADRGDCDSDADAPGQRANDILYPR